MLNNLFGKKEDVKEYEVKEYKLRKYEPKLYKEERKDKNDVLDAIGTVAGGFLAGAVIVASAYAESQATPEQRISRDFRSQFRYTGYPKFVKLADIPVIRHYDNFGHSYICEHVFDVDYVIEGGVVITNNRMNFKPYKTGTLRNYVQFYNSLTKQVVTYEVAPASSLSHYTDEFIIETSEGRISFKMTSCVYNEIR